MKTGTSRRWESGPTGELTTIVAAAAARQATLASRSGGPPRQRA